MTAEEPTQAELCPCCGAIDHCRCEWGAVNINGKVTWYCGHHRRGPREKPLVLEITVDDLEP